MTFLASRFPIYPSERRDNTYGDIEKKKGRKACIALQSIKNGRWGSTIGVQEDSGSIAVAIGTSTGTAVEKEKKKARGIQNPAFRQRL